jgi:hypothetical protein
MKLEKIQQDFIAAIFNTDRDTAIAHVEGDNRLDASQRLGIYRGSVHGILTQSLGDTFPVCKALVGDEFFDKMCDIFVDKHPPTTPFFSHYGDKLSTFLGNFDPVNSIPFLKDVAELEWSRHMLWQQASKEPFDFSQIASLNEEQQANIVFHISSNLHLITSDYRIDHIWFAHQDDNDNQLEDINIESETEVNLLIWKTDNSIRMVNFETNTTNNLSHNFSDNFTDQDYWRFLNSVSDKTKITELASEFEAIFPELLNKGIQDGWIESFTCD